LGLKKLPDSISTIPNRWNYKDYPNLSKMLVFSD